MALPVLRILYPVFDRFNLNLAFRALLISRASFSNIADRTYRPFLQDLLADLVYFGTVIFGETDSSFCAWAIQPLANGQ